MRWVIGLILLAGCSEHEASAVDGARPDSQCELKICQEGTIWATGPTSCERPDFQNVTVIGTCEHGCAFTGLLPSGGDPCAPPPPEVYACVDSGTCAVGATQTCVVPLACGATATIGACTCDADGWACVPGCSDGLCGPEAVQAAITGTWTGTVTTSFGPPYDVTITIGPDGAWSSPDEAFYWGGHGGTPGCGFYVLAQTPDGATGIVRLFESQTEGQITKLHVDATRLRFQMIDSWLECIRTLTFDLHRQSPFSR